MPAYRQQCDGQDDNAAQQEIERGDAHPVGETFQPTVQQHPGKRRCDHECCCYPCDELPDQQEQDASGTGPVHLPDADLFRPLLGRVQSHSEQAEAGQ